MYLQQVHKQNSLNNILKKKRIETLKMLYDFYKPSKIKKKNVIRDDFPL